MTKVTFLCFDCSTAFGGIKMTINEAIEILQKDIADPGSVDILDVNKAENLGIEALKLERQRRKYPEYYGYLMLPGETED